MPSKKDKYPIKMSFTEEEALNISVFVDKATFAARDRLFLTEDKEEHKRFRTRLKSIRKALIRNYIVRAGVHYGDF